MVNSMFDSRNLLSGKRNYQSGLLLLMLISIICLALSMAGSDDFDIARREVLLRRIGHQILLYSGDSTSRVLPVKKIAENEYQIRFENDFTFQPDSLVKIISRSLEKNKLARDYVVNVLNCSGKEVVYGYTIYSNKQDDI